MTLLVLRWNKLFSPSQSSVVTVSQNLTDTTTLDFFLLAVGVIPGRHLPLDHRRQTGTDSTRVAEWN